MQFGNKILFCFVVRLFTLRLYLELMKVFFKETWLSLIGNEDEFTMENRAFNAISIITLIFLLIILPLNIIMRLHVVSITILVLIGIQCVLYYFSRFNKQYHKSMILYAFISYVTLVVLYIYNSGINGPMLFGFFITFQLLVAFTHEKRHPLWIILHILTGVILLIVEYNNPSFIKENYMNTADRYIDMADTYVVTLILLYSVTYYLRKSYQSEKKNAETRADAIAEQNKRLEEIARIQSHHVRSHVATIMGLAQLFNENDATDPINKDIIEKIKEASERLDGAIKEIVQKT